MAAAIPFIGAGISAYGSLQQGEAQKTAYEMEAAAKRAQSAQVDISADREIELAKRRADRTKSAQMVAFGKSGVLATTGSPLELMEQTAADAVDEMTAIRNAANYRKGSLLTEAGLSSYKGAQAEDASYYGAAGSVLGAFSGSMNSGRVSGGNL